MKFSQKPFKEQIWDILKVGGCKWREMGTYRESRQPFAVNWSGRLAAADRDTAAIVTVPAVFSPLTDYYSCSAVGYNSRNWFSTED